MKLKKYVNSINFLDLIFDFVPFIMRIIIKKTDKTQENKTISIDSDKAMQYALEIHRLDILVPERNN